MSRTNPHKKKRRSASKTLFMLGEGFSDGIFLRHLRKLYSFNSGYAISIKNGKGGDAKSIVTEAIRTLGAFDKKIVVLDNDKSVDEMNEARRIAKRKKITLIENTPCLESLFLSILDKKPINKNSNWCKKKFESKYLNKNKRSEPIEYDKLFPKDLLDSKRSSISELDRLISAMKGKINK
jgi:MinD superfamily P-loop ATPase